MVARLGEGLTRLRLPAIDAWARTHGARMGEAAGWRVVEGYGALEAEVAAAREGVGVADVSAMGKVQVEGEGAAEVVRVALGEPIPPNPPSLSGKGRAGEQAQGLAAGEGWRGAAVEAYCIRPDLWLVLTPPGGEGEAVARLEAARAGVAELVTVTDLTHGLAAVALVGPRARDVLRRLCALDVSDDAMPKEAVRATSVAKTRQVIVRRDVGGTLAFTLVGARSLAVYVWEAVLEAGTEFGIAPVGAGAMAALEQAPV